MLVLGVDPGTRNLGWGLVRRTGTRLEHVAHGVFRFDPAQPLAVRLYDLDNRLTRLLQDHRPEIASVETIFYSKDAQAAAKLGHARGVVLATLARQGITVEEYAPAKVKRTVAGRGQAKKEQVVLMVTALLGLPSGPPSDAADALALAITHLRLAPLLLARDPGLCFGRRTDGQRKLRALILSRTRS